jgi:hypothetical protein
MSRGRFALLVALLAIVVAAVSFAAALRVLDDGQPDAPPTAASDTTDTTLAPIDVTSSSSPPPTSATTAPPGPLATPAWVTIVASGGSEAEAQGIAARLSARGYPSGVLHSDDYPSLKAGLWVAFAGPYRDATSARAVIDKLAADGFSGAYVRCAGTKKECGSGQGD